MKAWYKASNLDHPSILPMMYPHKTDAHYEEYQDWAYIDKFNEEHAHEVKGEFNQRIYLAK